LILIVTHPTSAQVYLNSVEITETEDKDTTQYYIHKIQINGNKKTKPNTILRELLFTQNEFVTINQIIAAQKRVQSLALFTRV